MAEMEQEEEDYAQEGPQFANVMPRTREEREADKDKDGLEKLRLQDRKGGHYKFHGSANPIMPYKDSLSYIEESERFSTDAAAEEYDRRQRKLMEKEVSQRTDSQINNASQQHTRIISSNYPTLCRPLCRSVVTYFLFHCVSKIRHNPSPPPLPPTLLAYGTLVGGMGCVG